MRLITVLVVACVVAVNAAAQQPINLVIMAGQSNCAGVCSRPVPVVYRPTPPNVRYCENYDNGAVVTNWGPLAVRVEPNGQLKWGAEYTLAHALAQRGGQWAIIKVSKGGSKLSGSGAISWNTQNGTLYQTLMTFVGLRKAQLEAQGFVIVSTTFLWIQGESDGSNPDDAAAYQSRLYDFLTQVRAGLGVNRITISEGHPISDRFNFMPIIWSGMEAVAGMIPNITVISQEGLPLRPSGEFGYFHLTKDGYLQLGAMLAASIP